jgi:hypothetical protein
MVGKDPHRPQGKTKDMEHMTHASAEHDVPRQAPSDKERAEIDMRQKELGGHGARTSDEDHIGGSRPGVPSRVKEAIEGREDRE